MKKPLTEAQVLAAPAKDYMNDDQLAFFRQRLTDLKAELLANVRDTSEHLRETEAASDPSDRATQEEEQAIELRTRDRERKLLKKIDEALQRIDEGTYGFCNETGEPIGVRRLLARPTATLSIEAQERRERMQKMYGD
jgi:DnaK suppressor protein